MTTFGHEVSRLKMTTYQLVIYLVIFSCHSRNDKNYKFDNEFVHFTKF